MNQPEPVKPVAPGKIRLGGEIGRRIDLTIEKNLLALDYDRDFLSPFRNRIDYPVSPADRNALKAAGRQLFNGVGETLDAAVFFAAYSQDRRTKDLKEYLVDALIETQDPDGYIGQFKKQSHNAQILTNFAMEDAGFICLGLANDARLFSQARSLEAARALMQCCADAYRKAEADGRLNLNFSAIGFCQAALILYQLGCGEEFLEIARRTRLGPERTSRSDALCDWTDDPPFDGGWHDLKAADLPRPTDVGHRERRIHWHVYRHLERMVTQMMLYRADPSESYLAMTRRIYRALTDPVRPGMSATGGIGSGEGWSDDQDSHDHSETCASALSLEFFDGLIRLDRDLRYGDLMERVIYNALFAAQEPAGRRARYFTPFRGSRQYYELDIFCCPGNFRRGISRLPVYAIYRFGNGVAVNLYTPCRARVVLADDLVVEISQETRYPNDGEVRLTISPSQPAEFPLHLRLPRWCKNPRVLVNGQAFEGDVIERRWRHEDAVSLSFPMAWRLVRGHGVNAGLAAVLRGPILFCLSRKRNRLPEEMELRRLVLDPSSFGHTAPDERVQPEGMACPVRAWSPERGPASGAPDLTLELSEFVDPTGEEVYFRVPDESTMMLDDLLCPGTETDRSMNPFRSGRVCG